MRRCHVPVAGLTVALVAVGVAVLAQEGASATRAPDDRASSYIHASAAIRLTPSERYAATLARDEQQRGTAAAPPPGRSSIRSLHDKSLWTAV